MESLNIEALLRMVDELDTGLDLYLAGASEASEAMPMILDACQRMRSRGLNNTLRYWIQCIESHASRISDLGKPEVPTDRVAPSTELLSIQIQQEVSFLRANLTNMRSLMQSDSGKRYGTAQPA